MTLEEANETRQALLRQVVTEVHAVSATNQQYADAKLFPPAINPQPILYFADPLTAEFATFGANPSADELTWKRWPKVKMTVQDIDARSVSHFNNPDVDPNDWFDGYEEFPGGSSPKALNLFRPLIPN